MLLLAHTARAAASEAWPTIPEQVVVAAVPGAHSRKPHLGRLLSAFVPPGVRCLEVCCCPSYGTKHCTVWCHGRLDTERHHQEHASHER